MSENKVKTRRDKRLIDSVGIYKKANSVVKQCGTRNAVQIANDIGIKMFYYDFDDLLGMYTYQWKNRIMILNSKLGYYAEQLVAAHELGHDKLHRQLAKTNEFKEFGLLNIKDVTEYEANAFASHILLDDDEVMYVINQVNDLSLAAQSLCVNSNLLLIKIREMNKLGYDIPLSLEYDKGFFNNLPELL